MRSLSVSCEASGSSVQLQIRHPDSLGPRGKLSGRHCPGPGTHHCLPRTARLPVRKLHPSKYKAGISHGRDTSGVPGPGHWAPRLWPETADGLKDLSKTRPSPRIPCAPKHLVSRAAGWIAHLQAPAPSAPHPAQMHAPRCPPPAWRWDRNTCSLLCQVSTRGALVPSLGSHPLGPQQGPSPLGVG